jgi:hypothetical protein
VAQRILLQCSGVGEGVVGSRGVRRASPGSGWRHGITVVLARHSAKLVATRMTTDSSIARLAPVSALVIGGLGWRSTAVGGLSRP